MDVSAAVVFIDTNLGTRFAAPLSPGITAMDFKRELEVMHLNCFPEFGSIKVNALMVEQRSDFYHLSESLPLEYAFLGLSDTRFLQIEVESLKRSNTQLHNLSSIATDSVELGKTDLSVEKETLCQFATRAWTKKRDNNVTAEALSDTFSEPASVSGIIKKYFSDYHEVASSRCSREWLNSSIECKNMNIQSPQEAASRQKHIKPQVGNRLLLASESLGLSASKQRPLLSLCRYNGGKSLSHKPTVGNLVFEEL